LISPLLKALTIHTSDQVLGPLLQEINLRTPLRLGYWNVAQQSSKEKGKEATGENSKGRSGG
jgi:hypothetical protein